MCNSLRTYFTGSTHQASVHWFHPLKSFELHKTFWMDEISAVYDVNLQHLRAANGPCTLSFVTSLRYPVLPFGLLSTHIRYPWKRRDGGKIRYTEYLYIISSTDKERCKRMHLVIIVCIPCVYVRRTWYVHFIRSASAFSTICLLWNCPR